MASCNKARVVEGGRITRDAHPLFKNGGCSENIHCSCVSFKLVMSQEAFRRQSLKKMQTRCYTCQLPLKRCCSEDVQRRSGSIWDPQSSAWRGLVFL
jgi:hypothetical protein